MLNESIRSFRVIFREALVTGGKSLSQIITLSANKDVSSAAEEVYAELDDIAQMVFGQSLNDLIDPPDYDLIGGKTDGRDRTD